SDVFMFYAYGAPRDLHSFPTRRSSDLIVGLAGIVGNGQAEFLRALAGLEHATGRAELRGKTLKPNRPDAALDAGVVYLSADRLGDRKSTRLNSSHSQISYAVFCLKKKT